MSCLIFNTSRLQLTHEKVAEVLGQMATVLKGRVNEAYVFGSASTGDFRPDSDIDLILVCDEVDPVFPHRGMKFVDLFSIYPSLDVLMYTPRELNAKLADSDLGFWKSARESMRRIV